MTLKVPPVQPSVLIVHPRDYGPMLRMMYPQLHEADAARGVEMTRQSGQRLDGYRSSRRLPAED